MAYRKDQCLGCGRPETGRPINLQTEWNNRDDVHGGTIDKDGTFITPCFTTHFWFCSPECYEKVLDTYIKDRECSLKYNADNFPPELKRKLADIFKEYDAAFEASDQLADTRVALNQWHKDNVEYFAKEWSNKQESAIGWARLELCHRLEDEYLQQRNDEHEKWMADLDKEDEAHERELARILKEGERKQEQRLREEEKRRKEEEKRAAEEAEEEKWRPKPFKL
jgi:hypothetical protein